MGTFLRWRAAGTLASLNLVMALVIALLLASGR